MIYCEYVHEQNPYYAYYVLKRDASYPMLYAMLCQLEKTPNEWLSRPKLAKKIVTTSPGTAEKRNDKWVKITNAKIKYE